MRPAVPAAESALEHSEQESTQQAASIVGTAPPGLLQGRYQVHSQLGAGGMSMVYLARDLHFGAVERWCAVKEMVNRAPDPLTRRLNQENFEREANILASLSHPSIPRVYDFFSQDDKSYLVMEYVDGTDLEHVWTLNKQAPLDTKDVVTWAVRVCDVLSYLHSHQPSVVFRDVKPSNIMLTKQQRVMLIDFGIAKVFRSDAKGTMIGTEGYAPPEQYRGVAEPRGDLYALGATMHHLLSGRDPRLEVPFTFGERPIHLTNPRISPAVEEAIARATEYDIDKRYGTAVEMAQAIMRAHGSNVLLTGPVRVADTAPVALPTVKPLWQFQCEDEVRSSPRILGTVLYVGCYDHNLYALDARTGKFHWKFAAEGGISSTPCVSADAVYIGSEDHFLYALNPRDGTLRWKFQAREAIRSSPRVASGLVMVGCDDGAVYAVHADTGTPVWRFPTLNAVRSSPLVHNDLAIIGSDDGNVYSIYLKDGRQRWKYNAGRFVMSTPVYHDGLVIVGSGDWAIHAVDARSGWSVWRVRTAGPVVSSGTVFQDRVYIGSADGHVYALIAGSGRIAWKQAIGGQVASSPAVTGDSIYVGSEDGKVHSLDARTGKPRWSFRTGGVVASSPLVHDSSVYVGSADHFVYALPA